MVADIHERDDGFVVRGAPESRRFSVFYLKAGRVTAVDSINSPADHLVGRKLVGAGAEIPPERLADTSIPVKELGAPYM